MLYTTNHDKNAWDGTEFEIFGPAVDAAIVFSFVSEGMPLIYNGQEAGNRKRLAFFERDAIQWQASPYTALYTQLNALKKQHTALWNGEWGARMEQVPNNAPKQVFSFVRQNAGDKVFAVFNLSAQPVKTSFRDDLHLGRYRDFTSGETLKVDESTQFDMAPWSYKIMTKAE
jgi:glycosidase